MGLVTSFSVSADGKWVCVGDELNNLQLWDLANRRVHASLPRLASPHLNTAFHPAGDMLVVLTASGQFYLFDVQQARLSEWSVQNSANFPAFLLSRNQKPVHVTFDPSDASVMLLQVCLPSGRVLFVCVCVSFLFGACVFPGGK